MSWPLKGNSFHRYIHGQWSVPNCGGWFHSMKYIYMCVCTWVYMYLVNPVRRLYLESHITCVNVIWICNKSIFILDDFMFDILVKLIITISAHSSGNCGPILIGAVSRFSLCVWSSLTLKKLYLSLKKSYFWSISKGGTYRQTVAGTGNFIFKISTGGPYHYHLMP